MTNRLRGISIAATSAGLACLAVAMAVPAQADDLNSTTCSEAQIMSSMQQNDPIIWGNISGDPKLEQQLRVGLAVLLAAPPGQRQQQVNTLEGILGYERWAGVSGDIMNTSTGPIGRAINSCHSF
jgi:hypothetical protein